MENAEDSKTKTVETNVMQQIPNSSEKLQREMHRF